MSTISATVYEKKFWARVARQADGCWEWTGIRSTAGYGRIMRNRKVLQAHRVAWMFAYGPIPDGLCVLHHCDNRVCVKTEPDARWPEGHLFLGTTADNLRDMASKGRGRKSPGIDYISPKAKIDYALAAQIRNDYATGQLSVPDLARKYGFGISTIGRVVNGTHRRAEHVSIGRSRSEAAILRSRTKGSRRLKRRCGQPFVGDAICMLRPGHDGGHREHGERGR